jgi:phospho-N-acetylmuramoyl-pentapeptide-transferase
MIIDIVKVITPTALAFIVGIAIAPILTHYLYKYKAWKKSPGKIALDGSEAVEFNKLHKENERKTPRMGGVLIWGSVVITTLLVWTISKIFGGEVTEKLDYLSRNQTWIPFFALIIGSVVGFVNDFFDVTRPDGQGLRLRHRLIVVSAVSSFVAWWFYEKLDVTSLGVPFNGDLEVGWFIIPFFILVSLALYASGVIDGIDGLSGGVFATIFTAYAGIAFYQQQIDLAAFSAVIAGATLAFLWFNIPPARFYMTETGTMGLTLTLAIIAFMTDSLGGGIGISILPIIAFPLFITVLSNILQVLSKKFRGKKLFIVAPIHHHFEAKGWPGYKVTMRFWIIGIIFALFGMIIGFIG